MSTEITTTFQNKYNANLQFLSQQMESRFRGSVDVEDCRGSEGARVVNQLGTVNPVKRTTRHADTPLVETPHDARWVYPEDYEIADLIDKQDVLRTIIEPNSKYARNQAMAMNRAIDDEIIAAFFSETTKTGKTGATTADWTTYGSSVDATSGLTVEALRQTREKLRAAEVDMENDPMFIALTAKAGDRPADRDADRVARLQREAGPGRWSHHQLHGLQLHPQRAAPGGRDDKRRCPAWVKSGMCLGIWQDIAGTDQPAGRQVVRHAGLREHHDRRHARRRGQDRRDQGHRVVQGRRRGGVVAAPLLDQRVAES